MTTAANAAGRALLIPVSSLFTDGTARRLREHAQVLHLDITDRAEVGEPDGDTVLLDDRPAVEAVELRQHRGEIDGALAERAEKPGVPRLLDRELP